MKIQTILQSTDQEFVDISTWQIIYSGRTPLKLMLSEAFSGLTGYKMTETQELQQEVQHTMEFIRQCIILNLSLLCLYGWLVDGLLGNQVRKGSHPRRIFFISILG